MIFAVSDCRPRKTTTAVPVITSRIRPTTIDLRSSQFLLALELTACFASIESGRAGNDCGGGDWPSIRFNALRMELKSIILLNASILLIGMLEYWNIRMLGFETPGQWFNYKNPTNHYSNIPFSHYPTHHINFEFSINPIDSSRYRCLISVNGSGTASQTYFFRDRE